MITDFQTNTVYFSGILPEKCPVLNKRIAEALSERGIPFAYLSGTRDIWCRDFMPVQTADDRLVFYNYAPDYLQDKTGLRLQTDVVKVFQTEANKLQHLMPKGIRCDLVVDGGNVVKCGDTVVMTDKVFEENRDKAPDEVERILREAFGANILFLPWDGERCGHSDGIVHYAGDGKVLLTNYDDFSTYYYRRYHKALRKKFDVITLKYNVKRHRERSWCYVNFLQLGRLLLVPQLGTEEDSQALEQIARAMPDCEAVGIPALEAVMRGGALNCISWNIKI